jgi:hypothetical protein
LLLSHSISLPCDVGKCFFFITSILQKGMKIITTIKKEYFSKQIGSVQQEKI